MKKLLFLLALSFTQLSFAQNFDIRTAPTDKNSKNIFIKENAPLVIANGNKTYLYASALNVNNIQSINLFKGEKAINLFGKKAKNGALEMTFKPETQLLNLQSFYLEYKISKENQSLPIVLNKHFVDEKEYLLLDKSAIFSVKILDEQPFVEPVLLPRGKAIYIEAMEMK
ncbi:hypothetical protein [Cloacibacterium normanense]|uniref:hypothetical protein n=1 Tax=Cloacibacterium normanense TaxID=237258 RepID=UPI00352DE27B